MKKLTTQQIRDCFSSYFSSNGHAIVPGCSLIPSEDPTLLFTNAGMVQFKEYFLGLKEPPYQTATSIQRCVRAGGKGMDDLDSVGDSSHHTFFEMLGNFSFGAYFKEQAIEYAWSFLTEELGIPVEDLWVTVHHKDKESEDIWLKKVGVDPRKLGHCGDADNFWRMGDVGPCGPCTEIFYDHGSNLPGDPPGQGDNEGPRFIEVWNLVFMQYQKKVSGDLQALPVPCVDTGMGLERIAAVLQGVRNNYDIDLFQNLLKKLSHIVGIEDTSLTSMRVIADHIRSVSFLIADGLTPSNEGRGYVLRRIIRRAVRHGHQLGQTEPFFYKMVQPLIDVMGEAYPHLETSASLISQLIEKEEQLFSHTLSKGIRLLTQEMEGNTAGEIPGQVVFHLYDTYGFPPDLTADVAKEHGFTVDHTGFREAMDRQREQSQQHSGFSSAHFERLHLSQKTQFLGYDDLQSPATVEVLLQDQQPVSTLSVGEKGAVVLDQTPFYAEAGGQVGDTGHLSFSGDGHFHVIETKKIGDAYLHYGEMISGELKKGDIVDAEVDRQSRLATQKNHTATHLLHAALRSVLGEHVRQKGSLVTPTKLRFDFSHPNPLTQEEWEDIESWVNDKICANLPVVTEILSLEDAKKEGAIAFFEDKYDASVRVLTIDSYSKELCGGTHVKETGEIALLKLVSEGSIASGIRRIEAVTHMQALQSIAQQERTWKSVCETLKTTGDQLLHRVTQLVEDHQLNEKKIAGLMQELVQFKSHELMDQLTEVDHVKVLSIQLQKHTAQSLRSMLDDIRERLTSYAVILATTMDEKVILISAVSDDCLPYFTATELLNHVAYKVGGKGGGRPNLAQGGGDRPDELRTALSSVIPWVKQKIVSVTSS